MDYKSVFTNLCLELQQNRSWIKGLGKNPFTHSIPFTHSLTAVPFVRGHRSVFPRTPRNTGVYTRHPTFVTATSGLLTRLPAWLSKNRMRVYTLSDMRSKKKLRVYTASEAKGLTSLCRRPCIHAKMLPIDKHAFRFLCVWPGDLSTRHAWHAIVAADLYARNRFSESMGSRFGGPGQKALQTIHKFTLFVDFCLIPLSKTYMYQPRICKDGFISIVMRPFISVRYAVCSTVRWSIIGRCVGACQRSNCAEERWL